MGQLLSHAESDASEDPSLQHIDGVELQGAKRSDKHEAGHHDCREGYNGDGLNGKGKGIDEFLNGERHDEREEPDGERIGENQGEDSPLQTAEDAQAAEHHLK